MNNQKQERTKIAGRLKAARERAHISVEDAAELAGVQPVAVLRWEKGASLPSLVEFRALLEGYGIIACEVLYDENPWALTKEMASELRRVCRDLSPDLQARVTLYLATHMKGVEPAIPKAG